MHTEGEARGEAGCRFESSGLETAMVPTGSEEGGNEWEGDCFLEEGRRG